MVPTFTGELVDELLEEFGAIVIGCLATRGVHLKPVLALPCDYNVSVNHHVRTRSFQRELERFCRHYQASRPSIERAGEGRNGEIKIPEIIMSRDRESAEQGRVERRMYGPFRIHHMQGFEPRGCYRRTDK
jgi:hypothetical protein